MLLLEFLSRVSLDIGVARDFKGLIVVGYFAKFGTSHYSFGYALLLITWLLLGCWITRGSYLFTLWYFLSGWLVIPHKDVPHKDVSLFGLQC